MDYDKKIKGKSFGSMGLDERLLRNIPYSDPTPIQRKTLPLILEKKSLMGVGRTGSGKTLCYLIPAIERAIKKEKTIILVPTRELVTQVKNMIYKLNKQIITKGYIKVTTPRLITDTDIDMLVVDEVDRILEEPGLKEVFDELNERLACQKIFFSATLPDHPLNVRIIQLETKISDTIEHFFFYIPTESKDAALLSVLDRTRKTIIFTATRYAVDFIVELLNEKKIDARGIFSSMDLDARNENFNGFLNMEFNILVVTDIAARGLNIPLLDTVINYDLCDEKTFLHRVGRVRGMGKQYSLINYSDIFHFFNIQETYLPNEEIGTIPQHILDSQQIPTLSFLKGRANRGFDKCLKFRRKVNIPDDYKLKIAQFRTHSMFESKETLLDQLKEKNAKEIRKPKIQVKEKENQYKDQLYVPYARTTSRSHTSAFGIIPKDDHVVEKNKVTYYEKQKMKKSKENFNKNKASQKK